MAKKLKKGATELFEELEKLLNEIFESSEAYLDRREKFGEEVSDHALTPSEKRYKDKLKAQQERLERKKKPKKKTRNIADSDGIRGAELLTSKLKKEIFEYSKLYYGENADELIQFADEFSTNNTGYMSTFDVLYINTDVMPGKLSSANSRLSWKAAIAHELEGHRLAALNNKTFFDKGLSLEANDLLEEIQASIRASKNGKSLSASERKDLLADAMERFQNHKEILEGTEYENLKFNEIIEKLWTIKY